MPIITPAVPFRLPFLHWEGHSQTIIPAVFRRIPEVTYQRERIDTPDDDFLDLDWVSIGSDRLMIITHGLEGSSSSQYVLGTARIFNEAGWDVLAWNCRSCSGEMNRQFRLYHHGDTKDIDTVVQHAIKKGGYKKVALTGYSMGANITMKYLGVKGTDAPSEVVGAVVFSAPCDLAEGADALDKPVNRIYKTRFMNRLVEKIHFKNKHFPGRLDISKLKLVRRWRDFDEWFSAPMCSYKDAAEFHRESSPLNFIGGIKHPTLLISAINDPFLLPNCFPVDIARTHPNFYLEMPENGGHCGFMVKGSRHSWAELRTLEWVNQL